MGGRRRPPRRRDRLDSPANYWTRWRLRPTHSNTMADVSEELPGIDPGRRPDQWPAETRTRAPRSQAPPVPNGRTAAAAPPPTPTVPRPVKQPEPVSLAAPVVRPAPLSQSRSVQRPPAAPPAARMLHFAAHSPSHTAAVAGPQAFIANPALRLAQAAVLAQGVLAIVTAVELVRGTTTLARIGSGVTISTTQSLATRYAIGVLVIASLVILGAVTVSVPSKIVRSLLTVLEVVLLGLTLAAHFGGGSVLGFATILAMSASGSAIIPFGGVVAIQSAVIYVLAIHPATYRAFAR